MASSSSPTLRIARLQRSSSVLGPGRRAVVWFQGCTLSCRGCVASAMNAAPPERSMSAAELAAWCRAIPDIEGVTLSGGDPFDQPLDALAELVESLAPTLTVMVYSGRTLAQLRASAEAQRVLAAIDVLVDSPYIEALNDGAAWRGSSNQVMHRLSARAHGVVEPSRRRFEVTLDPDGTVFMTGLPAAGRAAGLGERLLREARTLREGAA